MKAKKLLVVIVVFAMVATLVLTAACNNHTHEYTEWGKNDIQHWKQCPTDGDKDLDTIANHRFGSNGKCECGATKPAGHFHNYTEVGRNAQQHWQYCVSDAHPNEDVIDPTSYADHVYDQAGDKCVCGATKPEEIIIPFTEDVFYGALYEVDGKVVKVIQFDTDGYAYVSIVELSDSEEGDPTLIARVYCLYEFDEDGQIIFTAIPQPGVTVTPVPQEPDQSEDQGEEPNGDENEEPNGDEDETDDKVIGIGVIYGHKLTVTLTLDDEEYVIEGDMYKITINYEVEEQQVEMYASVGTPLSMLVEEIGNSYLIKIGEDVIDDEDINDVLMEAGDITITLILKNSLNNPFIEELFDGALGKIEGETLQMLSFSTEEVEDGVGKAYLIVGSNVTTLKYTVGQYGTITIIDSDGIQVGAGTIKGKEVNVSVSTEAGTYVFIADMYSLSLTAEKYDIEIEMYVGEGTPFSALMMLLAEIEEQPTSVKIDDQEYTYSEALDQLMPAKDISVEIIYSEAEDDGCNCTECDCEQCVCEECSCEACNGKQDESLD